MAHRDPSWSIPSWRAVILALAAAALAVGGCGDDDEGSGGDTASDKEQIEQVGNAWADPFGKGDEAMCQYLHPDLAPEACVEAAYLEGALTNGARLQSTFAGATVKDVEIRGDTAIAEFSNGHSVRLRTDPEGEWKIIELPQAPPSGSGQVVQPEF